MKTYLYDVLPKEFIKISVGLFENFSEKKNYNHSSIKDLLNTLFSKLTLNKKVIIEENSEIMDLLNNELTDYFDLFIQKLINNWLVIIENVFKFSINQYRINKTILELIK